MVLRILSTTTWQGLHPAMCFSNSSQIEGSTVPSTYSFSCFSKSSHFMFAPSLKTLSLKGWKSYRKCGLFAVMRPALDPSDWIAQFLRELFAQLQPRAQQAYLCVRLAETQSGGCFLDGKTFH